MDNSEVKNFKLKFDIKNKDLLVWNNEIIMSRTEEDYFKKMFIILEKLKIDPAFLENGRLDRMEHHLKLMKESVERTNTEIHKISSSLVGNEYTGGIGLVHKMDKLQKDISNNIVAKKEGELTWLYKVSRDK